MLETILANAKKSTLVKSNKKSFIYNIKKYKSIYLLMLPGILYFLIFHYLPMYGVIISFQDYQPFMGIKKMFIGAKWVGFKHFMDFFDSYYFTRLLKNTVLISFYKLLFGFPIPIILALLLNEITNMKFKKVVQTISYLPHFLSTVIITGMVIAVLSPTNGLVNNIIRMMGREPILFIGEAKYFRSILVISSVWASAGWGSIIYMAALSGVNVELYESAILDGASRLQRAIYISIPSIANIIVIMLILAVGGILNAGFEQVLLLYSPAVYEVGDIIDTYVFREGIIGLRYSYSSAISLFKNIVGAVFILGTNYISKKIGEDGMW